MTNDACPALRHAVCGSRLSMMLLWVPYMTLLITPGESYKKKKSEEKKPRPPNKSPRQRRNNYIWYK